MNLSLIVGNIGKDAEVKESNGRKFCSFSVAVSRSRKNEAGERVSETDWVDAVITDTNSAVIPFLKVGTKVAIVGLSSLRVYSSRKDRMMKAGQTIHVLQVELVGGSSDLVPRQLIIPETGQVVEINKFYWGSFNTEGMKENEVRDVIDNRGNSYQYDAKGFVKPLEPKQPKEGENAAGEGNSKA